tara:strand:+ start:498 stop:701 length:204 start_codon:yes stop_codon:yes gene_type:complete
MTEDITQTEGYKLGFKAAVEKAEARAKEKYEARLKEAEERMLERRKGAQDLRSGGMVISTVDNRKNK